MSKKKKKRNNATRQPYQKPETVKVPEEKSENYITIEIPDQSEEDTQVAQPEAITEKEHEEFIEKKPEDNPQANPKDNPEENPENEITIELPDSEAEKIKTFTPQVTAAKKPPLTPEQIEAKKHRNRTIITKTADVVFVVIITLMGLLMLLPIFFSIVQTFKSTAELGNVPQTFFPKDFTFKSFVSLFTSTGKMGVPFYRFIFNTLFVAAAVTFLRIMVTMPAAYVLAKVKAPMIKTLNRIVEWSLALTPALAFTLNNALISKTWFADTYFAVILPFITSPLCLVLMREAIRHIPDDTIAAAQMEGCSHITILRKFVIPQIRPIITAVAVLSLFEIGKISGGPLTFGETMDML
ncbi:MAG: carbohydrate ABC transporter permease, partial [Oscillospiraceae bacterium]